MQIDADALRTALWARQDELLAEQEAALARMREASEALRQTAAGSDEQRDADAAIRKADQDANARSWRMVGLADALDAVREMTQPKRPTSHAYHETPAQEV